MEWSGLILPPVVALAALFYLRRAAERSRPVDGRQGRLSSLALGLVFAGAACGGLGSALRAGHHDAASLALTLVSLPLVLAAVSIWVRQGWRSRDPARRKAEANQH
ncbi:hypothetical protein UG55_103143 [Frankia sp. EI5c]|uniref:hypothetical protein n=1 Tax=Frankia sp. EI5c TaxID=683316 RepID=UPI0007C2B6CA|nr:hypothetical protein [Frankia sp. EI5c]OAA24196.1 hypothetical protein UG55_103143 [Frankia sp. EI5c]